MSTRSPARSGLTGLYLSLLAYGAFFGLLQLKILPALGWSEGVVLLVCSLAASAVPLVWSRFVPAPRGPRPLFLPGAGQLVFLLSLSLTGNLVLMLLTPWMEKLWRPFGLTALPAPGDERLTPLLALYICVVGPVLEELVFRGVLLRRLSPAGARVAVVLSALCFGLMHHDLYQSLSAFWCGLVFGYVYLQYGLLFSVGVHMAGNSIAVLLQWLQDRGTAASLVILLLAAAPVLITLVGILRRLRRPRTASSLPGPQPGFRWAAPALWALLAFDTIYLILASFRRV